MNEVLQRNRELKEKFVNKIVVTNDGQKDYYNYVYMPETELDIKLIDLETGYAYAAYNNLEDLNKNLEDGIIRTIQNEFEKVVKITSIKDLI
jgi:hypothetical protein